MSTKDKIRFILPEKFKESLLKLDRDGYDAFFLAFTRDLDNQGVKVYVIPRKRQEFFNPTARINRRHKKRVKP
jgi:hypothetical protein